MYKYNKDGVTMSTILDTRRKKKSGLYPVKIQITYKRVQKYYTTGKELSQHEWDNLSNTKSKKVISIRNDIKNSFEKVENIARFLLEAGNFTFDMLNNHLGKAYVDSLNLAFINKINALEEAGSVGNAEVYLNAYRYMEKYAGNKVALDTITNDLR